MQGGHCGGLAEGVAGAGSVRVLPLKYCLVSCVVACSRPVSYGFDVFFVVLCYSLNLLVRILFVLFFYEFVVVISLSVI